ncbi:DNA primase large subunit [Trichinella sp. T6]|nr:DNA primase large subunit [Trichinella sp. T6]
MEFNTSSPIVNYASNNHYNKDCSIFFDCMHKLPEGGLGEFITHPNQYFDESRKLYTKKLFEEVISNFTCNLYLICTCPWNRSFYAW